MAHIIFMMPAYHSHAAVHGAVAARLAQRGHRVSFLGLPALEPHARREGMEYLCLESQGRTGRVGRGPAGFARLLRDTARATEAHARSGPDLLRGAGVDLAVVDEMEPGGSLAAEAAGVRRVTLAASLPMQRDPGVPPPYVGWDWQPGKRGLQQAQGAWRVSDWLMTAQRRALTQGCDRWGLARRDRLSDWIAPEGSIVQCPASLDFPRSRPPGTVVGPLRRPAAAPPAPLFEGRPYVFASLGTIAGGRQALLECIVRAAAELDICLALAHCGGLTEAQAQALAALAPGQVEVRAFFDQLPTIGGAAAVVCHGGLNTVLDAATFGVPILAVPLGNDQHGIAARLRRIAAARILPANRATASDLARALRDLLTDLRFRTALEPLQAEIVSAGGTARAADLVEAALERGR